MGCDTKGYIKNIELLPLIGIVHEVIYKEKPYYRESGVELCSWQHKEITSGRMTFIYDPEAKDPHSFDPKWSDKKEDRKLWVHSSEDEDPTIPVDWDNVDEDPRPIIRYGSVSLGMWGSATEIITQILMKAKEQGYEVYLHECDCDGPVVQL